MSISLISQQSLDDLKSVDADLLAHVFTTRALAMFIFVHHGTNGEMVGNAHDRACVEMARRIVALIPAADHEVIRGALQNMDAANAPARRKKNRVRDRTSVGARHRRPR